MWPAASGTDLKFFFLMPPLPVLPQALSAGSVHSAEGTLISAPRIYKTIFTIVINTIHDNSGSHALLHSNWLRWCISTVYGIHYLHIIQLTTINFQYWGLVKYTIPFSHNAVSYNEICQITTFWSINSISLTSLMARTLSTRYFTI